MSARISADLELSAARALFDHGMTSARAMADTSWQERVDALVEGGYRRYDEARRHTWATPRTCCSSATTATSVTCATPLRVDLDDDYDAVRAGDADGPTVVELQRLARDELYARAQHKQGRRSITDDQGRADCRTGAVRVTSGTVRRASRRTVQRGSGDRGIGFVRVRGDMGGTAHHRELRTAPLGGSSCGRPRGRAPRPAGRQLPCGGGDHGGLGLDG